MNLKQKALQGVVWSAIQNWGSQSCSFIVFLILARLLSPEAFGLVALANVFLAFMQIFMEQGFTQALIQRQDLESEHLNTAFWSQVGCGILLAVISALGAGVVAQFFNQPKLIPILQCLSLLFIVNSFGHVHKALLSREFAFKIMALRSLLGIVVSGIVGVAMAYAGHGVWSLVAQQLVYESVGVLVMWQAVDWRPALQFSPKHFQHLFDFGIHVLVFKFIKFFNKRSDNLLIGYFLGEVALGYYAIAYRILQVMIQLIITTFNQVALPTFSRLQNEPDRFRQAFYQATQLTSLIAFPAFLGVVVLTPELVISLFGEQWQPAIRAMQILAFEGIVQSVSFFHKSVFMSMGKPFWKVKLTLFNATINIIACLIVVKWGITAVALAYVVSNYLAFPLSQWAVNKLIKIPLLPYTQQFITPVVSSVLMVIAILIAKYFLVNLVTTQVLLIITIVWGTIIYILSIKFLNPQLFQQIVELVRMAIFSKKRAT
ncbi:Polysaccharide biosynthesis family protein [Hyella patelloides LEGE 07179]|uniref:Polysaccharide biosynthesis family protein n=1 Tax=Hyella patelloides LEGE 07179 TaxID=945734 RepID=A0A563VRY3_9CYAN|nr:MOP flippase family protein [Hyella patelloides]VEP14175.1 Polysaccharide biosynthesis family protein [Hyella patelloides LEGE 07179]